MKIYLLSQNDNNDSDTYDSCIVCAEDAEDAISICPNGNVYEEQKYMCSDWAFRRSSIKCKEIGIANKNQIRGVIIASFNAS